MNNIQSTRLNYLFINKLQLKEHFLECCNKTSVKQISKFYKAIKVKVPNPILEKNKKKAQ